MSGPPDIHVCIVTTAHPTDDVRVHHKFSHSFCEAGFRLTWVGPGQAFFNTPGDDSEEIDFRLFAPIRSRLDRVRAAGRLRRAARAVRDVDVYYAPDPDSARVAVKLAKRTGAKVIFDIHEVFHGAHLDRWLMGLKFDLARRAVQKRISKTCSRSSLTVGVSSQVLRAYTAEGQSNTMVVRSCAPSWFAETGEDVPDQRDSPRFDVMHGKCHLQRGTLQVLEAMGMVVSEIPGLRITMFTTGDPGNDPSAQAVLAAAQAFGISAAIDLRAGVPLREMPRILRACDVGLIAYGRGLGLDSLPNRLFEYMAAGLPVIAPVYASAIAQVVETEQCGLLADFEDPASIADAVVRAHDNTKMHLDMARRGRAAFLARHNWEAEVLPLINTIRGWFPAGTHTTSRV